MNFKILFISSMYSGSLDIFYKKYKDIKNLTYDEHYKLLLEETTEFVGSYVRGFRKLGFDAQCVIANDAHLQSKWIKEQTLVNDRNKDLLFRQVNLFQPDILWIDNLSFVDRKWLNMIRNSIRSIQLIIGYHCSPYGLKILDTLKAVDFIITCTPGLKTDMENNGLRSYLVYHGFDDSLIPKLNSNNNFPKHNFVFSGSLISGGKFHGERIKLIETILKENIDISLYVNLEKQYKIRAKQSIYLLAGFLRKLRMEKFTEKIPIFEYGKTKIENYSAALVKSRHNPVYGIGMYDLFSNSDIVLNMHIGVAGNFAGNMRLFEVTAVGSCLLTDNKKNLKDLFDTDNEVVVYDNPEDCIRKAKWLLVNETERKKIASNGKKRTLKSHTVTDRCNQISEIMLKEIKNKI